MNRPLTVTLHIGDKQIDKLTAEQSDRMAERLSELMSNYYSSHLEECKKIYGGNKKCTHQIQFNHSQ